MRKQKVNKFNLSKRNPLSGVLKSIFPERGLFFKNSFNDRLTAFKKRLNFRGKLFKWLYCVFNRFFIF